MDSVAKRQLVFSIFILLQSIKIFNLLYYKLEYPIISIVKWNSIDIVLILGIWYCRIPKLQMRTSGLVFSLLIFTLTNWLLFTGVDFILRKYIFLGNIPLAKSVGISSYSANRIDDVLGSREGFLSGMFLKLL